MVGLQPSELRVIGVDVLAGFRIEIARGLGFDRLLELAVELSEHDARILNGLQRVPRHHHVRRRVRAELQMQSGDRGRRDRISRFVRERRSISVSASGERGRQQSRTTKAGCGEQLAATEIEVERFAVVHGHGCDL